MSEQPDQTFIELEPCSEWRFELEGDENIAVRVQSPDPVYINSEELPPTTWYPLHRNLKAALYAPGPARIQVSSMPISQYTSTSTTQPAFISIHLALDFIRILAKRHLVPTTNGHVHHTNGNENIMRGPRVMVLGPPSSGKTSVVKNLVNMALGSGIGWTPAIVGLDPASPANLIPGSISLSTPSHPLPTHHLAHPLGSPPTSVPSNTLGADVPTLGWWYGHLEPTTKGVDLWRKLIDAAGDRLRDRCAKDPIAMASGLFVDTSSAFTNPMLGTRKDDPKARYSLLAHAIDTFDVDTLLVIGHEKLTIDLTRLFPSVRIIRIPKSGGAVDLDDTYRQVAHAAQVRGYFYGEPSLPKALEGLVGRMVAREGGLSPYSFQIGWEKLTVLRVGEENAAPSTALPLGSTRILSPTKLTKVDPSGPAHVVRLLNTVLALVHLTPEDRNKKETHGEIKSEEAAKKDGEQTAKEVEGEGVEGEAILGENEGDEDEDEVPYKEELGWREVVGFIVITGIDAQRKKYTILSPSPGKLPSTVAIAGQIEWVDSE